MSRKLVFLSLLGPCSAEARLELNGQGAASSSIPVADEGIVTLQTRKIACRAIIE